MGDKRLGRFDELFLMECEIRSVREKLLANFLSPFACIGADLGSLSEEHQIASFAERVGRSRGRCGYSRTKLRSDSCFLLWASLIWISVRLSLGAVSLESPVVLTQAPAHGFTPTGERSTGLVRTDFFSEARIVLLSPDGQLEVLSAGFKSACDPDVSFDGRRILFAGKKGHEREWAIWEMELEGRKVRRVTRSKHGCRSPIYLSSLFTLDSREPWHTIAYVGREETLDERGRGDVSSLYSVRLDGSELRRITFNPNADFDPFQMRDGRLIFSGWRYPAESHAARGRVSLFGMNIDGTDLELYGATQGRRIQKMGCAVEDGLVVFIESDEETWDEAGELGSIREGRPHDSYGPLTRDSRFAYLYPADLGMGRILVSRRLAEGPANTGLFVYNLKTARIEEVLDSSEYHELQAKTVRARPEPDGRSTVVKPSVSTGVFFSLNCYDTDSRMRPHIGPGAIRRLRVIEGVPVRQENLDQAAGQVESDALPASPAVRRRLLGEVPVEKDGSFNIKVPADTPVQLQVLDADGLALATCGWIWVKQNENRGCIGCHEDPELTPENIYVQAVQRPSRNLVLPPEKRRSVDFREHIMPILRSRCASPDCHGGENATPRLAVSPSGMTERDAEHAYTLLLGLEGPKDNGGESPTKRYVDIGRARTSPLIWELLGKDSSRPWDRGSIRAVLQDGEAAALPRAEHSGCVSGRELRALIEWIDLGAYGALGDGKAQQLPVGQKGKK